MVLSAASYGIAPGGEFSAGAYPDALAIGDFNGDGNADFVVANRDSNNVMFFVGNGDGTFKVPVVIASITSPTVMIATDLNGDGKQDVVVANTSPGQITILLGNGDGTFRSPILLSAANGLTSLLATDLNGFGVPSLVVTTGPGLLIFTGNGDGTFGAPVNYPQYAGSASVSGRAIQQRWPYGPGCLYTSEKFGFLYL